MNKSDSVLNLSKAFAEFQGEISNPKNSAANPFFKSKYAPLHEILELSRPILAKHGLSIIQYPTGNLEQVSVTTLLLHSSGEYLEFEPVNMKPTKNDPQGIGSAITYARRYSLTAVIGVAGDPDDDANEASAKQQSKSRPVENKPQIEPQQHEQQHTASNSTACADCGKTITPGVKSVSMNKFKRPLCMNCQAKAQATA